MNYTIDIAILDANVAKVVIRTKFLSKKDVKIFIFMVFSPLFTAKMPTFAFSIHLSYA